MNKIDNLHKNCSYIVPEFENYKFIRIVLPYKFHTVIRNNQMLAGGNVFAR